MLKNRKGASSIGNLLLTITGAVIAMLFMTIFASGFSLGSQGDISARSLGRVIDVATLTTDDVDFRVSCPGERVVVNGNLIEVRETDIFGSGASGQYYYMSESSAILPSNVEIDCSIYSYILIGKTTNPVTLNSTITVEGEI